MEHFSITEKLRNLKATERFELLYGPQKKDIEHRLNCKIFTLPLDLMGALPLGLPYLMVTDESKHSSYLAIFKSLDS